MFKINNKDTRTWRRSGGVFIANFEHVNADWVPTVSWTYSTPFPTFSIVDFELVMLAGMGLGLSNNTRLSKVRNTNTMITVFSICTGNVGQGLSTDRAYEVCVGFRYRLKKQSLLYFCSNMLNIS